MFKCKAFSILDLYYFSETRNIFEEYMYKEIIINEVTWKDRTSDVRSGLTPDALINSLQRQVKKLTDDKNISYFDQL